ncbi:transformation system protein [Malaciobacter halophilus]|uniref:Transformation system protein n=1 Tax=Malaciobacter halophilus TaxID=197482 RepID=A0A2N1J0K5_9BACT|nr:GspE/PulE family protein [Malaciobacter halophilus]AXH10371.1 type II secretion/transformation system, E protein [Malaciobacter halophilus]PKI80032.1 transformation system protein [Malaciobacter halophilus]
MKDIKEYVINYDFIKRFDIEALKKSLILPLYEDEIYSYCAVCKSSDIKFAKSCFFNLPSFINIKQDEILFYLSDLEKRYKLYNLYKSSLQSSEQNNKNFIEEFFYTLLKFSIEKRASDIHIETDEKLLIFRFRIDGRLKHIISFSIDFFKIISSYIKLRAKLDITQYRKALDGRIHEKIDEISYDFRVSFMPTISGESIVLRILDNKTVKKDLNLLEFSKPIYEGLKSISSLTQGLVLVCGPTGSGKTTTLYSILKSFDISSKKIITVEDPVEYKLSGITQINVNDKLDVSFSSVLKNILRQDPDIIFIGEIRDKLSLQIAIQASLTGHLVLSTIHSNSALNSISRLLDLNSQSFLLSSTLKSIFYQRLVLRVCPYCAFKGCEKCNYTKYLGRTAICEHLRIDDKLSSLIAKNSSLDEYKSYLKKIDYEDIYSDAKIKVKKALTTLDEVYKVLGFEDEV